MDPEAGMARNPVPTTPPRSESRPPAEGSLPLNFDQPPADPIPQFAEWFQEARDRSGLPNPNAMSLATTDELGRPSARIVLLKQLDDRGFVFFTNRLSRKGAQLSDRPAAALVFHWDPLDRQVRVEGEAVAIPDPESDAYFHSRPRESRLNAWASDQSRPIESRAALERRRAKVDDRFPEGTDPPRPVHWGGYRLVPDLIEFWQGHPYRLHDRVEYRRAADGWSARRLMP